MSDNELREALTKLLDRAQADGGAVVPIDVLRDLLDGKDRWYLAEHHIVFPGASHTWLMRHPSGCTDQRCAHAKAARWQFRPHDGTQAPGEYIARLSAMGDNHLYVIQIGQSQ